MDTVMGKHTARNRRREDGQAMIVELVLLFPLLLALLVAILEFGWWVNAHQVVSEAAHQAARSAAQQGVISEESVPAQVAATMRGGDLNVNAASYQVAVPNSYVSVSGSVANPPGYTYCVPEPAGGFAPELVKVTVTYQYHPLFPFLDTPMFFDIGRALPHTVTATAQLPAEQEWAAGAHC